MKVKDILGEKGSRVVTCDQDNSLMEALAIFSANRIGSLLVVDSHDKIQGILAPRDMLLAVLHHYDTFREIKVREIMTRTLIIGSLEDRISYIQAIMTENRVRHVPIIDDGELQGMISIGDVLKSLMTEKDVEIRYLKEYIEGKYPG